MFQEELIKKMLNRYYCLLTLSFKMFQIFVKYRPMINKLSIYVDTTKYAKIAHLGMLRNGQQSEKVKR